MLTFQRRDTVIMTGEPKTHPVVIGAGKTAKRTETATVVKFDKMGTEPVP